MKNTPSKKSAAPANKSAAGAGTSSRSASASANGRSSSSAGKSGASKAPAKAASKGAATASKSPAGKSASAGRSQSGGKSQANGQSKKGGAQAGELSSKLQKLFEDELKDILWAETALTKALPKMAKKATSPELKEALTNHLEETNGQIERIHQIFELIGKKVQIKKCEAMAGLLKEGDEIMTDTDAGVMRDAGIISAGQKVEHYEIASYGTLRQFAQTLGLDEVAALLQETLDEEKAADEKLTEVAESAVNVGAASEGEDEEEEDDDDSEEDADDDDDSEEDADDDDDDEEEEEEEDK